MDINTVGAQREMLYEKLRQMGGIELNLGIEHIGQLEGSLFR